MRALLVVNPFATGTTAQMQSVISAALANYLDLTVETTTGKFHAYELAKSASENGFELVIGLGGDGTLNEMANGILDNGLGDDNPLLAGIPGGNANVFLRNLGYSNDPIAATAQLLTNLEKGFRRKIGVGKISLENQSRWFLFNAGFGLDARVLARMEARRFSGKIASDLGYAFLTLRELFTEIRKVKPSIVITDQNGIAYERAQFALVINLAPWTYVGKFPISPIENSADTKSLDIFATYQLNISTTARLIKDLLSPRIMQSDSQTLVLTKQHSLKVSAYEPTWAQVDGEALAQVTNAQIEHFASCLTVIA
ncbi:MAG: hypothetical protein RIS61_643 [Actinomycetota bacterium]|jgi:diacylglycerol kinase family enzyme